MPPLRILVQGLFDHGYATACLRGALAAASRLPGVTIEVPSLLMQSPDMSREILQAVATREYDAAVLLDYRGIAAGDPRLHGRVVLANRPDRPLWFPIVAIDEGAAGRRLADFAARRGFSGAALVGRDWLGYWPLRRQACAERLADYGLWVRTAPEVDGLADPGQRRIALRRLIEDLPTGILVIASSDGNALSVWESCRKTGREVPRDVAVVGADDDPLVGARIPGGVTTLTVPAEAIGARSIELLVRSLREGEPMPDETLVASGEVIERGTTPPAITADPVVAAACTHIAERLRRGVLVPELAGAVGLPRRTLERRFRETLGRSVLDEIQRQRLARATWLLRSTELDLEPIADATGFATVQAFSRFFRQRTGGSPGEFRR